jgi:hypothetical protein
VEPGERPTTVASMDLVKHRVVLRRYADVTM